MTQNPDSVTLLSELLAHLYPEPGPDILTLDDFKRRYRLTGLGPLAIGAIQQAQRINREAGRFNEMGLCEFHIGLIYLDWNDYQGASQQFREARLQWALVDKTAAVCLAYLAEGLAQHHRYAYEAALSLYGKAESCQKRIKFEPASENRDGFVTHLNETLEMAQKKARDALWEESPTLTLPTDESREEDAEEKVEEPSAAATSEKRVTPPHRGQPSPVLPEKSTSPIIEHSNSSHQLTWYKVIAKRSDPLFEEIKKSGWLLVRKPEVKQEVKKNALLVVANNDPDTKASVTLEPLGHHKPSFPRIYLARTELEGPFTRTENQVKLSSEIRHVPVNIEHILGYVVGLWLEFGESEILDG